MIAFLVFSLVLVILAIVAYTMAIVTVYIYYTLLSWYRWAKANKVKALFLPVWLGYCVAKHQYIKRFGYRYSLQLERSYGWRSVQSFRRKKDAITAMRKIRRGKVNRTTADFSLMIVAGDKFRLVRI